MREPTLQTSSFHGTHCTEHCMPLDVASKVWVASVLPLCRPKHPESCSFPALHLRHYPRCHLNQIPHVCRSLYVQLKHFDITLETLIVLEFGVCQDSLLH